MQLDSDGIKAIIPHRDPFLLLTRVLDYEPGVRTTAELDVTGEMFWVPGHFPDYAVMPGVLIVESMAQAGAVALLSKPENAGKIAFFGGIDKVRFKRQVRPGETLRLEVVLTKARGPVGFGEGKAFVGDELACAGELMFAVQ